MNDIVSIFCPSNALNLSSSPLRVQQSLMQHRLDVSDKSRTSVLPWRGQFSPELIEYLLEEEGRAAKKILDPFCGSGTVSYEAAAKNKDCYLFDINPAAICLAQLATACNLDIIARKFILQNIEHLGSMFLHIASQSNGHLSSEEAVRVTKDQNYYLTCGKFIEAFLLNIFGNNKEVDNKKISRRVTNFSCKLLNIPYFDGKIDISIGDARFLDIEDGSIDLILTSPPYINVFNYHQNYRPIVEALGYSPLEAAKAELGANRKFRQNRFMTVIQYCIDMALFFVEASRLLSEKGKMVIVLGRESAVRGVSFKNAELIAAIASEGLGWTIHKWNERVFTNRYGEQIYEDVIVMTKGYCSSRQAITVGKLVGIESLRRSLSYAPNDRMTEIDAAINNARNIKPSPKLVV